MDILLRRTVREKLAEIDALFDANLESKARVARSSESLIVASEESRLRLEQTRANIEQRTREEKREHPEPRTADVLRLARKVLSRVQPH